MIHLFKLILYFALTIISFLLWKKENGHSKQIILLAMLFFFGQFVLDILSFPEPQIILDQIDITKSEIKDGLLIRPKIKNTGDIKAENVETNIIYKLGEEMLAKIENERQVDIHMGQRVVLGRFEAGPKSFSKVMSSVDPLKIEIIVKYTGPKYYFWQNYDSIFEANYEKLTESPLGSRRIRIIKNE